MKERTLGFSIALLFANIPLIRLIADCNQFQEYANSIDGPKIERLWRGYRKLFQCVMFWNILGLERTEELGLTTNLITERSIFVGVPMSIRPITSQKAIFIRNMEDAIRKVMKAKSYNQFTREINVFTTNYLTPIEKIFDGYVELPKTIARAWSKNELLIALAIESLFIFCNDMKRVPEIKMVVGLNPNILERTEKTLQKRLEPLFIGYKFGLAYIWNTLWENQLGNSPAIEILNTRNWNELDELFDYIRLKQIEPLEKHLGFDPLQAKLMLKKEIDLRLLGMWLRKPPKPSLSKYEEIDQLFLWYDFEILFEARSKVFSGTRTFIPMLIGEVHRREIIGDQDKIEILRIRHGSKGRSNYSYGILIESFGFISDYSGWLIFFNCCNDYSGNANRMRLEAEDVITRYSNYVHVIEEKLTLKEFDKFLKDKLAKDKDEGLAQQIPVWGLVHAQELQGMKQISNQAFGLLLELFTAVWFDEMGFEIQWDFKHKVLNNQQIDVLAEKDNTVFIVECQLSLPRRKQAIEQFVKEFNKKEQAIRKLKGPKTYIQKVLVYSFSHSDSPRIRKTVENFVNQGIYLIPVEAILKESRHSSKIFLRLFKSTVDRRFPPTRLPRHWK